MNVDTTTHPDLINSRFAYVSVSRASLDAQYLHERCGITCPKSEP